MYYALTSVCPKKMEYREQCHSKIALVATHLMQTIGLCSYLSYSYYVNPAFFPNPNSLSAARRKVRSHNIAFHDSTWRNRGIVFISSSDKKKIIMLIRKEILASMVAKGSNSY